jgi:hypothetical protein
MSLVAAFGQTLACSYSKYIYIYIYIRLTHIAEGTVGFNRSTLDRSLLFAETISHFDILKTWDFLTRLETMGLITTRLSPA